MTFSRKQAADAVAEATSERDAVQSNLLDLDASFGVRLLKGTTLAGVTKQRWDDAAAQLAGVWDVFTAYSAVIDRAAAIMSRRTGDSELGEVTTLLTGRSVEVIRGQAPLPRRDLADTGRDLLTVRQARDRMRRAFTDVAELTSAAEQAWNNAAGRLEAVASDLAKAGSLGDDALAGEVAAVKSELDRQRTELNSDPLGTQAGGLTRLAERAAAVAARSAELTRLRGEVDQRIVALRRAADAAQAAREDALAAYQRAAAKIARVAPDVPAVPDISGRLAAADELRAAGRWTRLGSELDLLERQLATAITDCRAAERTLAALVGKRDELRGLLDAYKAKAARLGAIEDEELTALYGRSRELLWTAPCDLDAAQDAVTRYQRAVLAMGAQHS
jgi:hypothetical protein